MENFSALLYNSRDKHHASFLILHKYMQVGSLHVVHTRGILRIKLISKELTPTDTNKPADLEVSSSSTLIQDIKSLFKSNVKLLTASREELVEDDYITSLVYIKVVNKLYRVYKL